MYIMNVHSSKQSRCEMFHSFTTTQLSPFVIALEY